MPSPTLDRREFLTTAASGTLVLSSPPAGQALGAALGRMKATAPMAPSPLVPSLGSYYTANDGFRHAIAATIDGRLHEVFYNPKQGTGRVQLACFDGIRAISAFYSDDDGLQHPIVATNSGEIYEVWYKPGDFHVAGPLAVFPNLTDVTAFYAADDHMRIVIAATSDGSLFEVFYNPGIGIHVSQPALGHFPGLVSLSGFYSADDHYRHVIVATADGAISELFYHPSIGVHVSHPPLARFPGVVDIGAFYAADDGMRIVLVATRDGQVHEVFYRPDIGAHVSQPALATFNNVVAITGFYTADDHYRHAVVAAADGSLTEVFYHPSIGTHISQPALAQFSPPILAAESVGPDLMNLTPGALSAVADDSPSGRCLALAGTPSALYTLGHTGGLWKSVNGGPWALVPGAPLPGSLDSFNLADEPGNQQHVVVGSDTGLWESMNGGATWVVALDPVTLGAGSSRVGSVAIDDAGRVFVGIDNGVAVRPGLGKAFTVTPAGGPVTAIAVAAARVWARTAGAVMSSTTNGSTWSAPVNIPGTIPIRPKERAALAGTDQFAYLVATKAGMKPSNCAGDNQLVIYDVTHGTWSVQPVISSDLALTTANNDGHTCDGTGSDASIDGRRFVKAIRLRGNPNQSVGQGIQLFFGGGQEVWRARGQGADGTITDWNWVVGTHGPGYSNRDPVHADIWDVGIDPSQGGQTAWIAGDGGVYTATVNPQYNFVNVAWKPGMAGLHTHQIQTLSLIRMNAATRSRLAYVVGDNSAWLQDGTAHPLPEAPWDLLGWFGDGNWSVADPSTPNFILLWRHLMSMGMVRFDSTPVGVRLINPKTGSFVDPALPTRFQFIPSPRQAGTFASVDAVMMVDLPFTHPVNGADAPFPNQPGANTNGAPVLVRNRSFDANPDINAVNGQGLGWTLEVAALPSGAQGFYVGGGRQTPTYYCFTSINNVLSLYARRNGAWVQIATSLVSSRGFGPAFVNPYEPGVLYALTTSGIQVSSNGGLSFAPDARLSQLVRGADSSPMSIVSQIAFSYDNPSRCVVGTARGDVFYSPAPGSWVDVSSALGPVRASVTSVGIDCTGIYVGTFGRSVIRITGY